MTAEGAPDPSEQELRWESSASRLRESSLAANAQAQSVPQEGSGEIVGRYTLLSEIGQGVLTTIYLARQQGSAGFQRLVALKRLHAPYSDQSEAQQLMLDEGRLTSSLHHANIVGVLDVGTEAGPYVVMEYVEGDDLESLLQRAGRERHPRFTVPLIVDVLNGLHAVHTAVDDRGAALGMVHQAPRGRHVLVGIDGTARLTDFTQARARIVAPSRLRADRLKVSAMAPEQALSPDSIDHRTDLFIVGLLLWETLTGEPLFSGDGEAQTFQNLLHRRIPKPSEVGLRSPRCFDAICLRALERDPRNRYASALDMARDLRDTALNQALFATNGEIGQWVKALSGKQLIERRRSSGSDAPSYELPTAKALSSSGYHASIRSSDPYGSGLIYGGSFTRVGSVRPPVQRGSSADLDQTPAIGVRASFAPTQVAPGVNANEGALGTYSAAEPDEEHTPRHVEGARPDGEPRVRRDTDPMWKALSSSLPPPPDADTTHPAGFVPTRPGERRDTGLPSPGAYSEIKERKVSQPPASAQLPPSPFGSEEGIPTMRRAVPHEDLMDVTTVAPLSAAQAALIARAMQDASPAPSERREPLPLGTPKTKPVMLTKPASSTMLGMGGDQALSGVGRRAAVDGPSPMDSRLDSKPTRLSIPAAPIGSPYRAATPSKMPGTFDLPKAPARLEDLTDRTRLVDMTPSVAQIKAPPRTLEDMAVRTRNADALRVGAHSLSPPDSGARTLPPVLPEREEDLPTGRSYKPLWITAGVLVAIICVAIGVGARRWFEPENSARRVATQPALPPQPVSPTPASPSSESLAPAPSAPGVANDTAAKPAYPPLLPSTLAPAARASTAKPTLRKPAPAAPRAGTSTGNVAAPASQAVVREAQGPREVDPALAAPVEPSKAPSDTPRPKRRQKPDISRGSIPDNPY